MKTFAQTLAEIRANSINEDGSINKTKRGFDFENIMLQFFKKDGEYSTQFKGVKLWRDHSSDIDTGIDLIATDYHDVKWAIQCKCWDDDANLTFKKVGTTFATAMANKIDKIIIVFTGRDVTSVLKKKCEETGARIIRRSRLEDSAIEWDVNPKNIKPHEPYKLREHQKKALNACLNGFVNNDRGKCIMACGTGKTLTSLHIAEKQVGKGGSVLYLVPSISLVRQTIYEWAANRNITHDYLTVCSDKTVGMEDSPTANLSGHVTTDANLIKTLFEEMLIRTDALHVVFSTYQSSDKVREAFADHCFDLIIFDEAHRTAGAVKGSIDTNFTLAHHDKNIQAKKRLYMTATPRIHKESDKVKADETNHTLYSMEDKETFGEVFYKLKFSDAIDLDILTDYRVVAFGISKKEMADIEAIQGDADITLEESTKLSSVYNAILSQDDGETHNLLRRVIVFCNSIKASKDFSIGRNAPKRRSDGDERVGRFMQVVQKVNRERGIDVHIQTDHVDGRDSSRDRGDKLNWLKADFEEDECRILSNAQCLSEGVDVPALNGVVFYEPRSSVIDVVQAVGRVMRRKEGKEHGYVIIPVVTTAEGVLETASRTNKTYKTLIQVLDALRDHDDRIDRLFNQVSLTREQRSTDAPRDHDIEIPPPLEKSFEPLKPIIMKKVGGFYFEDYGKRLGEVAADIELKIRSRVARPDHKYVDIIDNLHANLAGTVGETVTRDDTIRALAQHVTIKPVFDQLFRTDFSNPVSDAFDAAVAGLSFREETEPLQEYYDEMAYQIENITDERMRQVVIKKIYDNFFKGFDKKTATEHGIVYTPVEAVDYIIHSIQYVLQTKFGVGFNNDSVEVLDPFAGTGVFIARLMQSGLLGSNIYNKYKKDLHMNELLLLAYYVATVNIETTYHRLKNRHVPYDNACYVDTFTLDPEYLRRKHEGQSVGKQTRLDKMFQPVLDRVTRQQNSDITVIMGNPPWNVNKSKTHEKIEQHIGDTYGKRTTVKNSKSQKNSYIKALRWASDRIGDSGVIGFVVPASWLSGNTQAGLRAALYEEFTDIWCFDLLGEKNKEGHGRNMFEYRGISTGGTTQQSTIVLLVKNTHKTKCTIHYTKLGVEDYSGEDKRNKVKKLESIQHTDWEPIEPNEDHDWFDQRDLHIKQDYYTKCMPMGADDDNSEPVLFDKFSQGITSGRDPWVYNVSYNDLVDNMKLTISHCAKIDIDNPDKNPKYVHWGSDKESSIGETLKRMHPKKPKFDDSNICLALYRPFIKHYLYYDTGMFISRKREQHKFFPDRNITDVKHAITVEPVSPNPTQPNPTQPNPTQPNPTQPNPTQPNPTQPNPTQPNPTQPNPTQPNPTQPNHTMQRQGRQTRILHHNTSVRPTSRHQRANIPIQEGMNVVIIVPDKIKNEFSAFISNLPPDLHIHEASQAFPMVTYRND